MPVRTKGHWARLAIGGLIVLNIVLLLMLFWPRAVVIAGPPADQPESSPTPTDSEASPGPSPAATPNGEDRPRTPPSLQATRLLAVNSDRVGWRATITKCGTPSEVEVTTNGGRTWRSTETGLTSVSRLKTFGETAVFAVGTDDRCRGRYRTVDSPDGRWVPEGGMLSDTWYREAKRRDVVHAPGGRRSRPCDSGVADLAGLGTFNAVVLCQDGSLARTENGAEKWDSLRLDIDVKVLNADDLGYVAAGRSSSCGGVAVVLFDSEGKTGSSTVSCAPVGAEGTSALGVAVRGELIWVWADDRVLTSTNGGRSW